MGPSPSANQPASRAPWSRLCEDNNCVWEAKIYRDVFEWWTARISGNKTSLLPQSHVFSENKRKPRTTKYTINVNRLCTDSSETFNFNNLLVSGPLILPPLLPTYFSCVISYCGKKCGFCFAGRGHLVMRNNESFQVQLKVIAAAA